jgi:hypothetical protein
MGVGGRHAPAAFTTGKEPVPIVQEAEWAPGLVLIGAENLAPTGIRSLDLPVRSESLNRLRYPGPLLPLNPTVNYENFTGCHFLCRLLTGYSKLNDSCNNDLLPISEGFLNGPLLPVLR